MKWRVEKSGGADEGRQPLNIPRFTVFCALPVFGTFSDLVV